MGLDNGIYTKLKKKPPKYLHIWQYSDGDYEILYWRKYWGVREMILEIVGGYQDNYCNDGTFEINYKQMKKILVMCVNLCRKKFYDEYANSYVFTFEDSKKVMRWNVLRAWWLLRQMKKDPSIKVYFYDSY